jgi:serine/threonine-protein kinase
MAPLSGARVGSYEIGAQIGVGGMGEVYRARDTKLNRDVAMKVLPEAFANDPDRLARFEREAQLLAALNHPNIAQIYGLEDAPGQDGPGSRLRCIVMELVEGDTLADRLRDRGALELDEALGTARQIAEALEAAHDQGIIHRDLKPGNVNRRPDGVVKVLDFGLGKLVDEGLISSRPGGHAVPHADPFALSHAATITSPAVTRAGIILGTAAYMAPEQVRGAPVDRRADVWSFGVVLFEMLSGRTVFDRASMPETLAAVMRDEPDWAALPSSLPSPVRDLLRRCLTKDPRSRLQAIGEARIVLELAMSAPRDPTVSSSVASAPPRPRTRSLIAASLVAVVAVATAVWALLRPEPAPLLARLTVTLDRAATIVPSSANIAPSGGPITAGSAVELSPDGQIIAFRGQTNTETIPRIYLRRLDQLSPTPLEGSEGAGHFSFSPDGRWIAFALGRQLKKVPVTGGTPTVLTDLVGSRGAVWTTDGRIVLARGARTGLSIVSAEGGPPVALTTLDKASGEITHRFPEVLPGDKAVVYTANTNSISYDEASIMAVPLSGGSPTLVLRGGYAARYVPSGHLVYLRGTTLFAVPFDVDRVAVTGTPAPIIEGVLSNVGSGIGQFSVSSNGSLVYLPDVGAAVDVPIVWLDERGTLQPIREGSRFLNLRLSPDGHRMAVEVFERGRSSIWILDLMRGVMSRVTGETANEQLPVWTPDGRRLVFSSNRDGASTPHLYWRRVDGAGATERLTSEQRSEVEEAGSWLPDGRSLAFTARNEKTLDEHHGRAYRRGRGKRLEAEAADAGAECCLFGTRTGVLTRRPLAGVCVERVGDDGSIRKALPGTRWQGADLVRWRVASDVVSRHTRAALFISGIDQGGHLRAGRLRVPGQPAACLGRGVHGQRYGPDVRLAPRWQASRRAEVAGHGGPASRDGRARLRFRRHPPRPIPLRPLATNWRSRLEPRRCRESGYNRHRGGRP